MRQFGSKIGAKKNKDELLNSKSEFNHPPLSRVVVEKRKNYVSKKSKNQLKPNDNPTLYSIMEDNTEDPFHFGTEVISRPGYDGNNTRVQLSSEQEIHLESTMLIL